MVSRTPQYGRCRPASTRASLTGKGNRRIDTRPEKILISALRKLGIRINSPKKSLPGNPDMVFWKHRLVVFCDGDFWHGKEWRKRQRKLRFGWNSRYWLAKINYNRERDKRNTKLLKKEGWSVIRLWESDISRNPSTSAKKIKNILYPTNLKE